MYKPYYSDYVRHMMRFYSRHMDEVIIEKTVDGENWLACNKALKPLSARDKDILTQVYGAYDTLADNVYEVAKQYKVNQGIIWDMMKKFEKKLAEIRGLI